MITNVVPPPALPHPPTRALARPTQFLSKNAVVHAWPVFIHSSQCEGFIHGTLLFGDSQGTNVLPRIPMKKRTAYSPPTEFTVPASPDGMAPIMRRPAITLRGPKRSTRGPQIRRTISVAHRATMLEVPKNWGLNIEQ